MNTSSGRPFDDPSIHDQRGDQFDPGGYATNDERGRQFNPGGPPSFHTAQGEVSVHSSEAHTRYDVLPVNTPVLPPSPTIVDEHVTHDVTHGEVHEVSACPVDAYTTLCGVHSNISPFVFGDVVTDGGQIFTERDIKSNQAVVQIPTSSQLIDGSSNALIALQQHNITACIDGELLLTLYRLSNIYSDTPAFCDDLIYRHGGKQSNLIELNLHGENITYCSASEIFNSSYYPILRDTDTIHHILCVPPYRVDQYHDCIYITSSTSVHGEKLSTVVNFNLYGENIIHHPNEIFNSSCYPILRDVFNHYHDHQSIQHNTTTTGDALIGNVQLQDALTSITYRCSSNDIVFVDNVVCIIDGHQDVDCSPSSLHLTHSVDHSKTDRHHKISICSVNHPGCHLTYTSTPTLLVLLTVESTPCVNGENHAESIITLHLVITESI